MAGISQAYVIDAVRTAVGKRGGALAGIHPVDLGALGWRGLLDQLSAGEAFGRAAEPWEVAATIAFLASDYSSYLTGEVISVSSQHP